MVNLNVKLPKKVIENSKTQLKRIFILRDSFKTNPLSNLQSVEIQLNLKQSMFQMFPWNFGEDRSF